MSSVAITDYLPSPSPLNAPPDLRAYIEREFQSVARSLNAADFLAGDVREFGAKLDGVADDTTAIVNAIAAASPGSAIFVFGRARLTSLVTVNKRISIIGRSPLSTQASRALGDGFIKDAAMTTAAFDFTVDGGAMSGLTLDCEAGNTGDGVMISAGGIALRDFAVYGAGQDGIRVGDSAGILNCNQFHFQHVRSDFNSRDGIRLDSGSAGGAVNANIGLLASVNCQSNAGSGVYVRSGFWNVLLNVSAEGNAEYGVRLGGGALVNWVYGGDRELNTLGDLRLDAGSAENGLIGVAVTEISDAAPSNYGLTARGAYLPSYTVAGLPSAALARCLVYVSNESGGAVPAFSDGTNWRRVTDRAIVS